MHGAVGSKTALRACPVRTGCGCCGKHAVATIRGSVDGASFYLLLGDAPCRINKRRHSAITSVSSGAIGSLESAVGTCFRNVQFGSNARSPKCPMHAHRIREEQVACSACENVGPAPGEVTK